MPGVPLEGATMEDCIVLARTLGERVGRELAGLAHCAPAVRIELELDPVADEATVGSELHCFEARDLLHEGGDAHQPTLQGARAWVGEVAAASA